jgi:hypothetical protein
VVVGDRTSTIGDNSGITCLCSVDIVGGRQLIVHVSLTNISDKPVGLNEDYFPRDFSTFCQSYLIVDGIQEPMLLPPVEDAWPYGVVLKGAFSEVDLKPIVLNAGESIEILREEAELPERWHEVLVWARFFIPDLESKITQKGGGRGPVIQSNTIMLKS